MAMCMSDHFTAAGAMHMPTSILCIHFGFTCALDHEVKMDMHARVGKEHQAIEVLNLADNHFGPKTGVALGEALKVRMLRVLEIHGSLFVNVVDWNHR